ncbi:hypothetical protein [Achromobacter sp. AGC39]
MQDNNAATQTPATEDQNASMRLEVVHEHLACLEKEIGEAYLKAISAGASPLDVLQVGIAHSAQMLTALGIENGNDQEAIQGVYTQITGHIGKVIIGDRFPAIEQGIKHFRDNLEGAIAQAKPEGQAEEGVPAQ